MPSRCNFHGGQLCPDATAEGRTKPACRNNP
ncbi:hypothetical protein E2C01_074952 [Portunus trituberculatus]|uniref:Uncharacterized protein n=1 Tax=Portunus trituberculatus TaxID=210409 RepID=A0A5B7IDR3_PORTR|nr:hypothetical protein [Portunus trituberculatus]